MGDPQHETSRRRGGLGAGAAGLALCLAVATGCADGASLAGLETVLRQAGLPTGRSAAGLDAGTIASGLREALRVGTQNAVSRTSRLDGFLGSELIRIRLPESIEPMTDALRTIGFGRQVDELEVGMNRAAERAAGEAADVFLDAISRMTIDDARGILQGGDTAATEFFRRATSDTLRSRFEPIVTEKMQTVGLARLYDSMVARYRALPIPKKEAPALESYVTDRALDGLFTVLGQEEQRIRTDPAARVTELLRTVFGS